jgi:hypothetical protein
MTWKDWAFCRNVGLHRKLVCLRKTAIETIGCYSVSGMVSFALVAGIELEQRCREETSSCGRYIRWDSTAIRVKQVSERLFSTRRFLEKGLLCYLYSFSTSTSLI